MRLKYLSTTMSCRRLPCLREVQCTHTSLTSQEHSLQRRYTVGCYKPSLTKNLDGIRVYKLTTKSGWITQHTTPPVVVYFILDVLKWSPKIQTTLECRHGTPLNLKLKSRECSDTRVWLSREESDYHTFVNEFHYIFTIPCVFYSQVKCRAMRECVGASRQQSGGFRPLRRLPADNRTASTFDENQSERQSC